MCVCDILDSDQLYVSQPASLPLPPPPPFPPTGKNISSNFATAKCRPMPLRPQFGLDQNDSSTGGPLAASAYFHRYPSKSAVVRAPSAVCHPPSPTKKLGQFPGLSHINRSEILQRIRPSGRQCSYSPLRRAIRRKPDFPLDRKRFISCLGNLPTGRLRLYIIQPG